MTTTWIERNGFSTHTGVTRNVLAIWLAFFVSGCGANHKQIDTPTSVMIGVGGAAMTTAAAGAVIDESNEPNPFVLTMAAVGVVGLITAGILHAVSDEGEQTDVGVRSVQKKD